MNPTDSLPAPQPPTDLIELLPVSLLDQNRPTVTALKDLARALRLEFGWHYLLDLTWILERLTTLLPTPRSLLHTSIMDAGAGTGILQWYLAAHGAEVASVDRMSRAALPLRFRRRFRVSGMRPDDLLPAGQTFLRGFNRPIRGPFYRRWAATVAAQTRDLMAYIGGDPAVPGAVRIYNQDLAHLPDIPSASLDAVVSVSALEHNTPEGLQRVVAEIMRTLKPGGVLLATLTAGRDQDWWHEASSGWCYNDASLRRLFDLDPETPSNYARYDKLLDELRECAELRDNLARFYLNATDKGMPGGIWDPQYLPVGVCKIKR